MGRWTKTSTPSGLPIQLPGGRFDELSLFTDDNDHNPTVAMPCPQCNGRARFFTEYTTEDGQRVHADGVCAHCDGRGVIDRPTKLFSNDRPAETVRPNAHGFVTCPGCGRRFTYLDQNVWTGRRHICGQRITIDMERDDAI